MGLVNIAISEKDIKNSVSYNRSWYEANILVTNKRLRFVDAELIEKKRQEKTYKEGFTADGGVVLDASRYGVTNIYEAVQLFEDFLHF